jgi:hypothetical protein
LKHKRISKDLLREELRVVMLLVAAAVFGDDKVWRGGCREIEGDARRVWSCGCLVILKAQSTLLRQQSRTGFCSLEDPNEVGADKYHFLHKSHLGNSYPIDVAGHLEAM